ncbi:MAG: methionine--tRNA ligase [Candidatus Micrarchaeia archaeon]
MAKYIVTSALPYVQGMIHLGNLIGSILPADIYYKYLQMNGQEAIFICGSDEHGSAIEIEAIRQKTTPKELADKNHERLKKVLEQYGCTFTHYGRTGTEQNKEIVYAIFNALDKNGYLAESVSEQPYCNVDKRFIPDRFIEGTCPYCGYEHARGDQCEKCGRPLTPKELINPHCTICGKSDITFKQVKNLALNLEKLQGSIKEFIEAQSKNNWSRNAINDSEGYLARGLKNREITRDIDWGFKVPKEGYENKVFYVWFDALIGYIGITYEYSKEVAQSYWLDKNTRLVQFMGKDNIEPHTLMWPAMLIGSNLGYILPTTIYAYEFLNWEGQKFSKSRHIGMNLEEALEAMPGEYWRFALASILPETADTDFTLEVLQQAINSELNDGIGNFIHRTLTLVKNNFNDTSLKPEAELGDEAKQVLAKAREQAESYNSYFSTIQIREALKALEAMAAMGNEYLSRKEPWQMLKQGKKDEALDVLSACAKIAHDIGILLYPFMPNASRKICYFFGTEPNEKNLQEDVSKLKLSLADLAPLFSKLSTEQIKKISSFSAAAK